MSQKDNFWDGDLSDISDTELDLPDPNSFLELTSITSVGKDGRTARTYKYLAGIASGAQAVKVEWLFDSAKRGTLVPVDGYLITGDTAMRGCSLVSKMERGKLLAGYNVCVWKGKWDAGSAHTHEELLSLICTLGAKLIDKVSKVDITASDDAVVDIGSSAAKFAATVPVTYRDMFTKPTHSTRAIILVDPDTIKGTKGHSVLDDITRQTAGAYPCRTKSWLFDCISANKVI
ncbi:hypothetical protein LPJ53_005388 [Coemansia erecta]|uniref:BRCT domain-containing protein n=1 Tax=Coemansia erecta TaxID=147472 RepID=A0A9W7XWY4_9FUNG|nr:hypothetical protein LPJ53_005388 [Coemansia erecta]